MKIQEIKLESENKIKNTINVNKNKSQIKIEKITIK